MLGSHLIYYCCSPRLFRFSSKNIALADWEQTFTRGKWRYLQIDIRPPQVWGSFVPVWSYRITKSCISSTLPLCAYPSFIRRHLSTGMLCIYQISISVRALDIFIFWDPNSLVSLTSDTFPGNWYLNILDQRYQYSDLSKKVNQAIRYCRRTALHLSLIEPVSLPATHASCVALLF
jgi:hypothetical protein